MSEQQVHLADDDSHLPTRRLVMRRAAEVTDDVPTWGWEYGGRGRIAVGTLALWAGRPGAGKSTAARWFAANASAGTLDGCWIGTRVSVAYVAREESVSYIVKPSLRAHNADLQRVFFPEVEVTSGDEAEWRPIGIGDMNDFKEQCKAEGVRLVIVDPLMATLGSNVDAHRNNEVRAHLDPWRRLAEDIDGIVIGVVHLNKSGNGDIVAGINGSSAFGEIARSVFGFAKDPDSETGERVMSQEKNSMGDESLALTYRIDPAVVQTDSGRSAEVGQFVITGDSDRSVGEVLRDAGKAEVTGRTDWDAIIGWLYSLLDSGPVEAKEVYRSGDQAGYSKDQLKRAKAKADDIDAVRPVNPGPWLWQRAGSRERKQGAHSLEALPAPCEVRGGFQGAGSRERLSPLVALTGDGAEADR